MSQPQQAGSQAAQQLYRDLLNELAFQKVLLASIDDSVENQEEAKKEITAEIKSLHTQLRAIKKSRGGATSKASSSASQISESLASTSMENQVNRQAAFANASQGNGSSSGLGSSSSATSTPNSNMELPDIISPSMSLPTRKRSHSKHLDNGLAPFVENKSRRTSPSPYMGSMTPMSDSGYGYPVFGGGFYDLTEDDFPDPLATDFLNKLHKAEEEKAEQERLDAEFARQLQDENSFASMMTGNSPVASSSRVPNAFDRMHNGRPQSFGSSQTSTNQPAATGHRKLPWANQSGFVKSEGSSNNVFDSGSSAPSAYTPAINPSRYASHSTVKTEPSSSRPRPMMPGAFVDDSDSDIEVIDAANFHDNGRYSRSSVSSTSPYGTQAQRPGFSPESQAAGSAALRRDGQGNTNAALHLAMFGERQMPSWMNGAHAEPLMGTQGPMSPFGNAANINGSGMQSSMSLQHPGPSLGYTVDNLPTYDQGYNLNQQFGESPESSTNPIGSLLHQTGAQIYESMAGIFGNSMTDGMAEQVDYIINDPRKTTEEIKALLENIQPDDELPVENREGTPEGMKYGLYEHQKIALTWLKQMEDSTNKGGILADDMGLGKTISSIALILSRPSNDRARKTTLIVGPVALVRQWDREVKQKVRASHSLTTHMLHGPGKKLTWSGLRVFDIVFTTYGTLAAEFKRLEKWRAEQNANGVLLDRDLDQTAMENLFPLLSPRSLFHRVILDEAQCIKNKLTGSARAACELKSVTRFCLTGTPMMNNVTELYSLIRFLRIKPYNELARFKQDFGMLTKGDATNGEVARGMRKLQAVLKAIMLRRMKGSLIDGKPIITLPPKTEEIQHVVFSEDEQVFYNSLESKTRVQFNKYMRQGTVGKNYSNILVLLLRLRQCCCHPHLITDFDEGLVAGAASEETMLELAKSLDPDVVSRILATEGTFECPVCYDAVLNPSIVVPCGHDTCSECLVQIADKSNQQNVANGEEGAGLKCPSCRGKIEMGKIIDYSSFKKVHMPGDAGAAADDEPTASENDDDSTESDSDSETESEDDADENGDLQDFIVPDIDTTEDENSDADPIEDDETERPSKRKYKYKSKSEAKAAKKKEEKRRRKIKNGKQKTKEKKLPNQPTSMALLKKEASRSIENRRRYMKYLKKHFQPSAKVDKCVELLEQFQNDGQKTIVFSQFVALLDLLQVPIDGKKWKCERYDGGMKAEQRNDAINRFTDDPSINIMLISLKAGNAGLNLVAASRVIILDPFWNPYIEMQAIDRAHRIGQQRPVEVHRILIQKTVEDRIIELQESKKKLINAALDENASSAVSRLGERELAFLFGVGSN